MGILTLLLLSGYTRLIRYWGQAVTTPTISPSSNSALMSSWAWQFKSTCHSLGYCLIAETGYAELSEVYVVKLLRRWKWTGRNFVSSICPSLQNLTSLRANCNECKHFHLSRRVSRANLSAFWLINHHRPPNQHTIRRCILRYWSCKDIPKQILLSYALRRNCIALYTVSLYHLKV